MSISQGAAKDPALPLAGLVKTSLVDYPGRVCATVFIRGCNLRCPYCHNPELVTGQAGPDTITVKEVLSELAARRRLLDGVCISGGEPTLAETLREFIRDIRSLGLAVKLDTNGTRPQVLRHLLAEGLVDYVALDIKGPPHKYKEIVRSPLSVADIQASVLALRESGVEHELRTTAVPCLLGENDFIAIGEWLQGASVYFLQQFRRRVTLDPRFRHERPYSGCELAGLAAQLRPYFRRVEVRGVQLPSA